MLGRMPITRPSRPEPLGLEISGGEAPGPARVLGNGLFFRSSRVDRTGAAAHPPRQILDRVGDDLKKRCGDCRTSPFHLDGCGPDWCLSG
jgi:hypothetical protein